MAEQEEQKRQKSFAKAFIISILISIFFLSCEGFVIYRLYQAGNRDTIKLKHQIVLEKQKNKDCEFYEQTINCMSKTLMVAYGLSRWESHYYAIIFNDFSKQFEIPWEIYPAIVRIESNFKCNTGSPKGAKGMMQLLEGTGKEVAEVYGIDYIANQTLWNTTINLVLGCGYLSKNIKEKGFEGGVKSYLGGPDYLKSVKSNAKASQYIGEYKSSVWKEYRQLGYIFRGIVNESNKDIYNEIHSFHDTITTNTTLFDFTKDTSKIRDTTSKIQVVKKHVKSNIKVKHSIPDVDTGVGDTSQGNTY
jgi:hypothetical protein